MENLERFYNWMLAMGNVHLADNEKMAKAYEIIAQSNAKSVKVSRPTELILDKQALSMPNFVRV